MKDNCRECLKKGDETPKELFKCKYCKFHFCAKHITAKDAFFPVLTTLNDVPGDPVQKSNHHLGYGREDGHPCFEYMRKNKLEIIIKSQQDIKQGYRHHYKQKMNEQKISAILLFIIGLLTFFLSWYFFNLNLFISLLGILFIVFCLISIHKFYHWKIKMNEYSD